MQIVRRRLQLHPDQAFFLLLNEKSIVSNSMTMQVKRNSPERDLSFTLAAALPDGAGVGRLSVHLLCKPASLRPQLNVISALSLLWCDVNSQLAFTGTNHERSSYLLRFVPAVVLPADPMYTGPVRQNPLLSLA